MVDLNITQVNTGIIHPLDARDSYVHSISKPTIVNLTNFAAINILVCIIGSYTSHFLSSIHVDCTLL